MKVKWNTTIYLIIQLDCHHILQNISIDLIIYFETNPEVSIRRLSGRRVCRGCGANFHLTNMPPRKEGICDFCGGKLFLRDDDKEETVKKRLAIYQKRTASLIDYYKKSGYLRKVSGDSEANQLNARLIDLFARENLRVKWGPNLRNAVNVSLLAELTPTPIWL